MARTKQAGTAAAGIDHNARYIKQLETELALLRAGKQPDDEISPTKYVRVMSLCPYGLNLSTKPLGQGKIFRFDHFGQVKRLLYSDLSEVLETNQYFHETGHFIILDEKVVRLSGYEDLYAKIMTKETIEAVLTGTPEALALFEVAGKEQKDNVVSIIIERLVADPNSMDLNIVDKISRISGVDIARKVKDAQFLFNPEKEEEEEPKK